MTDQKRMEYATKLHALFEDRSMLKGNNNGIDRYSAIVAFNETFFECRDTSTSPLADIAFVERKNTSGEGRTNNFISKLVIKVLSTTDWYTRYGMSYKDVMELPYADWVLMEKALASSTSTE